MRAGKFSNRASPMRLNKNSGHSQSGSVILYILIGVVLLGMLYYISSRSSTGTSVMTSKGNARAQAAAIVEFANQVTTTTQKLLSKGCSEQQINTYTSTWIKQDNITLVQADNSTSPSDGSCNIFQPKGSITPLIFPTNPSYFYIVSTQSKQGTPSIRIAQMTGSGTDGASGLSTANDLILNISGVSKDICMQINNILNVANPSSAPPTETSTGGTGAPNAAGTTFTATGIYTISTTYKGAYCGKDGSGYYIPRFTILAR